MEHASRRLCCDLSMSRLIRLPDGVRPMPPGIEPQGAESCVWQGQWKRQGIDEDRLETIVRNLRPARTCNATMGRPADAGVRVTAARLAVPASGQYRGRVRTLPASGH